MKKIFLCCLVISIFFRIGVLSSSTPKNTIYDLDLIIDSPRTKPTKILFQVGTKEIVKLQQSLINELSGTEFIVILSPFISEEQYLVGINKERINNIRFINYSKTITDWSQDRYMRFVDKKNKSVLIPVMSAQLHINERAPFEFGIPELLRDKKLISTNTTLSLKKIAIDANSGEIFSYSESYKKFFTGEICDLFYGENGDRLTTENFLFVGASTLQKMLNQLNEGENSFELLEKLLKRKIIAVDNEKIYERYFLHVDLYMTPVEGVGQKNENIIFMGSLEYTLKNIFENVIPEWVDENRFMKKIYAEKKIKDKLSKSFKVIEIPLLYISVSGNKNNNVQNVLVSFNNGIFDGKNFFAPDYAINNQEINLAIQKAKKIVSDIFSEFGLNVKYIEGGEDSMIHGGEIRCSTAVLETRPVVL